MISSVSWNNFWTLPFGLSQFHGHGSWLVCEVALNWTEQNSHNSSKESPSWTLRKKHLNSKKVSSPTHMGGNLHEQQWVGWIALVKWINEPMLFIQLTVVHASFLPSGLASIRLIRSIFKTKLLLGLSLGLHLFGWMFWCLRLFGWGPSGES